MFEVDSNTYIGNYRKVDLEAMHWINSNDQKKT
jgi:hypothetical protein